MNTELIWELQKFGFMIKELTLILNYFDNEHIRRKSMISMLELRIPSLCEKYKEIEIMLFELIKKLREFEDEGNS